MKGKNRTAEISEIEVTIVPETWIIAPIVTREQVRRWIAKGWMTEEDIHLDRAFPRLAEETSPLGGETRMVGRLFLSCGFFRR